jgi:hypothetical protein
MGADHHHLVGVALPGVGQDVVVVRFRSTSVEVNTRITTASPAWICAYRAAASAKLSPTTGMPNGRPRVPMNSSVRPGLPSLTMITASSPAATALATLTSKKQVPRWTSATAGSAGAGG